MNGAGGGCVRLACGPFQAALLIDMSTSRRLDCMTCMSIKTNDGEWQLPGKATRWTGSRTSRGTGRRSATRTNHWHTLIGSKWILILFDFIWFDCTRSACAPGGGFSRGFGIDIGHRVPGSTLFYLVPHLVATWAQVTPQDYSVFCGESSCSAMHRVMRIISGWPDRVLQHSFHLHMMRAFPRLLLDRIWMMGMGNWENPRGDKCSPLR